MRPYVIAGIIVAVAVTGAALWEVHNPTVGGQNSLGLAWAERNRALLLLTLGYLAVVLVSISFGWVMVPRSPWYFLPRLVIEGSVLLLGSIGFALAQRPLRSPGA